MPQLQPVPTPTLLAPATSVLHSNHSPLHAITACAAEGPPLSHPLYPTHTTRTIPKSTYCGMRALGACPLGLWWMDPPGPGPGRNNRGEVMIISVVKHGASPAQVMGLRQVIHMPTSGGAPASRIPTDPRKRLHALFGIQLDGLDFPPAGGSSSNSSRGSHCGVALSGAGAGSGGCGGSSGGGSSGGGSSGGGSSMAAPVSPVSTLRQEAHRRAAAAAAAAEEAAEGLLLSLEAASAGAGALAMTTAANLPSLCSPLPPHRSAVIIHGYSPFLSSSLSSQLEAGRGVNSSALRMEDGGNTLVLSLGGVEPERADHSPLWASVLALRHLPQTEAAAALGMNSATLRQLCRQHGSARWGPQMGEQPQLRYHRVRGLPFPPSARGPCPPSPAATPVAITEARMPHVLHRLSGLWTAQYGGHGAEIIQASYSLDPAAAPVDCPIQGARFQGLKLIGDVNVPSGQHSFAVDASSFTPEGPLDPDDPNARLIVAFLDNGHQIIDLQDRPLAGRLTGVGQINARPGTWEPEWQSLELLLYHTEDKKLDTDLYSILWRDEENNFRHILDFKRVTTALDPSWVPSQVELLNDVLIGGHV
ncbi:MAG: hypothetical protein WDW36_001107 [Sanguina aurantia]